MWYRLVVGALLTSRCFLSLAVAANPYNSGNRIEGDLASGCMGSLIIVSAADSERGQGARCLSREGYLAAVEQECGLYWVMPTARAQEGIIIKNLSPGLPEIRCCNQIDGRFNCLILQDLPSRRLALTADKRYLSVGGLDRWRLVELMDSLSQLESLESGDFKLTCTNRGLTEAEEAYLDKDEITW